MNNKKIEDSLRRAVNQAPTVDFEKLSAMQFVKMADHDHITRQRENRKTNTFKRFSAAVSFCLVMLVCFSGWFIQNRLPDSVITLDVNPSIEIVTNMRNQILTVKALNEDAQGIVGDHDYKNADLRETMDTLLTSMIGQGYLTEKKNTIMISVENKNIKKAESLSLQLEEEIKKIVSSQNITPNLLRQVFTKDTEASAAAGKYGISAGKTRLIHAIIASSGTKLSFDALAKMSIEDLFAITEEYTIDLHDMIESDDDYDADEEDESAQPANIEEEIDHDSQSDDDQAEKKSTKSDDQAEDHSPEQTIDQIENNSSEKTTDQEEEDSSLSKDPDSDESDSDPPDTDSDESSGSDSDSSDSSSDDE